MKKSILIAGFLLGSCMYAQHNKVDSTKIHSINNVIVIGTKNLSSKENKPMASLDDYLQKSGNVMMIKRGAYAWEPLINNMPMERTLITIDGMRVFGACTDKMDPITSYVEVSNLNSAVVNSGQRGSEHGQTIGGSIDLNRHKSSFGKKKLSFGVHSGFESVNQQKIIGTSINFKNQKFYLDTDFMRRDAENYKDGNGNEVLFSQFRKLNFSGITGFRLKENQLLEASVIYDKATDVGYPALPMDVSLAEALITSLKYEMVPNSERIKNWETKIYYNQVTHRMDDTKRPLVPIHMDMPGWNKTFGYYSKLKLEAKSHQLMLNVNGFLNNSLAEMTMYPNNSSEKLMFMLTWPNVNTLYQGIYLEDIVRTSEYSHLKLSGSLGFHQNKVVSDFGLNSLKIFYPEISSTKTRLLKNFAGNYTFHKSNWEVGAGVGYGERAASVSEGYGFYLYNSFEQYDYVGNPNLKNESSLEGNVYASYHTNQFFGKISSNYFHIQNYIAGEILPNLVPMTIGAKGVKQQTQLDYATIFNINFDTQVRLHTNLRWLSQIAYNRGMDYRGMNLPFISPISYRSGLEFNRTRFSSEIIAIGNAAHRNYSPFYGEKYTPSYVILNAGMGYQFDFGAEKMLIKLGIENIFNKHYNTYSDWNRIPRFGRNFYLNIGFNF